MATIGFCFADVAIVYPQDPVLRMGSNLTVSCWVHPDLGVHANSLFWTLNGQQLPSSLYRVLSPTNLSVTLVGLNASRQTSGDNLVCHNHKGHILAGSCLYVGSKLNVKMHNFLTVVSTSVSIIHCKHSRFLSKYLLDEKNSRLLDGVIHRRDEGNEKEMGIKGESEEVVGRFLSVPAQLKLYFMHFMTTLRPSKRPQ